MKSKTKKEFISPASLKACFYLWVILFLLTPVAYIYDYNGFYFVELRNFSFALVVFYTLALTTYIEIKRIKQPNNIFFHRFIIINSHIASLLLLVLFGLSILDYNNGNLKLERIYDPVIELFFLYLLHKGIKDLKQNSDSNEISLLS